MKIEIKTDKVEEKDFHYPNFLQHIENENKRVFVECKTFTCLRLLKECIK